MKFRDLFKDRELILIAEIGINHNGDADLAARLVEAAERGGADAVKFQTFVPERMFSRFGKSLLAGGGEGEEDFSQIEFFGKLMLGKDDHARLSSLSAEKGMVFFSSPFDVESLELLESIDVPIYKVASSEVTNLVLLREIGATGKPVVMSTGICTEKEIGGAIATLVSAGAPDIVLMHCVSLYPLPPERVNLRRIAALRDRFGLEVGFSDHSPDFRAVGAAAALGARIFEKHFTLSDDYDCPDMAVSLTPERFLEMRGAAESVLSMMGHGRIDYDFYEKDVAKSARRSLYAKRHIPRGTVLTRDDIAAKRPGTGLSAALAEDLVGRRAVVDIQEDHLLRMEYFE